MNDTPSPLNAIIKQPRAVLAWTLLVLLMAGSFVWTSRLYREVVEAQERAIQAQERAAELALPSTSPLTLALPNFRAVPWGERKAAFLEFMHGLISEVNHRIEKRRVYVQAHLKQLAQGKALAPQAQIVLKDMLQEYRLSGAELSATSLQRLLQRMDIVPVSLALAQAANESGWGTSRFARLGNNLFGEWCFTPGCGIVPMQRMGEATHEVRRYAWPYESVVSYVHNLNTHKAYQALRAQRRALRRAGQSVTGLALVGGLKAYSERGMAYVDSIRAIINANGLAALDGES